MRYSDILEFFKREEGLSVVEYVVGAAFLVVALTAIFLTYDDTLINSFNSTLGSV
ncbi:hypothetical protein L4C33_04325 [Vibrio makurazakiensis]|uniref:Flp family type IVb pilin n=1 Tax=Vibrio makurazakiensis TaxID=2910250 RepID=UPI003D0E6740